MEADSPASRVAPFGDPLFRGGARGWRLRLLLSAAFSLTSLLGIALTLLLAWAMVPYGSKELAACGWIALPVLLVDYVLQSFLNERMLRPVYALFERKEEPPRALRILALRSLVGFPWKGAGLSLALWLGSTLVFAVASRFIPPLAQGELISSGVQCLVGVGLVAFVFQFHIFKLLLHRPLRELAPTLRGIPLGPIVQVPIRWKLGGALIVLVSVTVYLAGLLATAQAKRASLRQVGRLGADFLALPAPAGGTAEAGSAGARLVTVDETTGALGGGGVGSLPEEVRSALAGEAGGTFMDEAGERFIVLARRDPSGPPGIRRAALLPLAPFHRGISGIRGVTVVLLLFAWGMTLGVAFLLSQDVSRPLSQMVERAGEVARGDLRGTLWRLSEDEAGDLSEGFRVLVDRVRDFVRATAEAVECLDGARESLSRVGLEGRAETAAREAVEGEILALARKAEEGIARLAAWVGSWVEEGSRISVGGRTVRTRVEEMVGLADRLGRAVDRTVGSLQALSASVEGVGGQSEDLSRRSRATGAVLAELGGAIQSHRDLAGKAAEGAEGVRARAEGARNQVQRAVRAVRSVADQAEATGKVLDALKGRVREIGQVLEFLDDISQEAHMLSINAAILSQQVTAGQKIAVVAQEIKQLVQKSRSEAKKIAILVREVQRESEGTSEAMRLAERQVREGTLVAREADDAIRGIAERAAGGAGRIRTTVEAAGRAATSATSAITGYGEVSHRLDGLVEEAVGEREIARRLREAAGTMEETGRRVLSLLRGQVPSAAGLSRAADNVLEMVTYVNQVMADRASQAEELEGFVRKLREESRASEEANRGLTGAVETLGGQVEILSREAGRFQL